MKPVRQTLTRVLVQLVSVGSDLRIHPIDWPVRTACGITRNMDPNPRPKPLSDI